LACPRKKTYRCRRHALGVQSLGVQWFSYRKIPSLKHYLVFSQDERVVQMHSRAGDLWRERFISAGAIELDDPPVHLEIEAIYAATDIAA
jgi:hypothetical protein